MAILQLALAGRGRAGGCPGKPTGRLGEGLSRLQADAGRFSSRDLLGDGDLPALHEVLDAHGSAVHQEGDHVSHTLGCSRLYI